MDINLPLALSARRLANGKYEWFFSLSGLPVYPTNVQVGRFLDSNVPADKALGYVIQHWARTVHPVEEY
jgi:hypothetical protein